MMGKQPSFTVFGNDYATPDGTCIRDFIHVSDLAAVHRLTLEKLETTQGPLLLNCGYGHGHSILELIRACERVTGKPITYTLGARREGDIEQVIASIDRLNNTLSWTPKHNNIEDMIRTSLDWEIQKNAMGRQALSKAS
jgi:UDP-glucose 4-epimerase